MSSGDMPDFSDDLDEQSYEIKDELEMRKVLEQHTDWMFVFNKHEQYAYDMRIKQWHDEPETGEDNHTLGFVELERSRRDKKHSWITGDIPESWPYLSFLKRKIQKYDHDRGSWLGLKENHRKTIYLKFNHAQDNCFAAPVQSIFRDGVETKASDGSFNNSYLELSKKHPDVHVGIQNCVSFIERYLENRADQNQHRLGDWV
jgi:adenylate kinase family enzyme